MRFFCACRARWLSTLLVHRVARRRQLFFTWDRGGASATVAETRLSQTWEFCLRLETWSSSDTCPPSTANIALEAQIP